MTVARSSCPVLRLPKLHASEINFKVRDYLLVRFSFLYNTNNASDPFKLNPVRQTNNYKMADQSAAWPVADAALSQVRRLARNPCLESL